MSSIYAWGVTQNATKIMGLFDLQQINIAYDSRQHTVDRNHVG